MLFMSEPLRLYANDTWLIIRDKKDFYKRTPVSELRGLLMSQAIALSTAQLDEKGKSRVRSSIKRLRKVISVKTGKSLKKKRRKKSQRA